MKVFLKVKIKSLAAEAVIIRREERRFKKRNHPVRLDLAAHRRFAVRPEARDALLAYGFLRGRAYKQIEAKAHKPPNWQNVSRLAAKYGTPDAMKSFEYWRKGESPPEGIIAMVRNAIGV